MKKRILIPFVLLAAAVLLYAILHYMGPPEENYLKVSGRVEASEIALAARIPGRLKSVLVEDGSVVKAGDVVAVLDDAELRSRRRELVRKTEELAERIKAAEFDLKYTETNVRHTIDEAGRALSIARARLKQALDRREKAEKDFNRYGSLRRKGVVPEQRYEEIRLAYRLSEETVHTAEKEVELAEISLLKAKASRDLVRAKEQELLALRKSYQGLKERLKQVEITLGYTRISAPVAGVVLSRVAEPGEILPQGGVAAVMIDPDSLHVKTFVPEKYIGRIFIDMEAEVLSDAYPDSPFTGRICYISDRAEFTPKEVQSYEERVKQVFAVKICFPETAGDRKRTYRDVLKKGMPVDVRFRFRQDGK
ncbi:MAG: HlyD family efflux transporter periplasmic adaptor subunit [Nitrospirae bacterium]|nr:HlyD family efflux transporter periplasmic adaptor subunit [Nitrospirota bacterium]